MPVNSQLFHRFPDPVSGYELNPFKGYFSVIIPEATTNLVTNPSVEYGTTTGYAAYGGAMAGTYAWQAFGAGGLLLTPAVSTESGFYFGTVALTINLTYTASVVIQGEAGKIYYIWFASTAGALIGTKRAWIGTGHKQRIWVTTIEPTGASRRVYVSRDAKYADQNVFYADGLQVEAKAYPTTYCDGSLPSFVKGQRAYYWNGTNNLSTSSRIAGTRTGGREVSLLDLGLRILAVVGLGMAPLVDQALPVPGLGELPQGTGTQAREFTLVGALFGEGGGGRHLQAVRDDLIDAFKPDLVTYDQPLILRYQPCDEDGEAFGESLDIVCKYRGGLEGNWDNHQQERMALNFKMYMPLVQNTYDQGIQLGYQTTVANANYIIMRDSDGNWEAMGTGAAGGVVFAFTTGLDGTIYAGGTFTSMGGVANTAKIAAWNGTAWAALGNGADDGIVQALVTGPDGSIYAAGSFTGMNGVANTSRIAKWDPYGLVWTPLGTGAADATVYALYFAANGYLYATGNFSQMGGIANTLRMAKWSGSAWSALGTGLNGNGYAITSNIDGSIIYVGGGFTLAGGVANTAYIAAWNGATWAPLLTGVDNDVLALARSPGGLIYLGGRFTHAGSKHVNYIAAWNGNDFIALGSGVNSTVYTLKMDGNFLYAGGIMTYAGEIPLPDRMTIWTGTTWMPFDVDLFGAPTVYTIEVDSVKQIYVGFSSGGSAVSATVTVPDIGSGTAYPIFTIVGPGTLWQIKNYTTGKAIYFDLTLLSGEDAVLNLNPLNPYFYSSFRGNIWNLILPGSNTDMELLPGNNNISAYIYGATSAGTKIFMTWWPSYWSLDGAVWK